MRATPSDLEEQLRRELAEAREQQTATSEVLQVISSSPGELEPVFEAILANATRICEAKFGILYLREGEAFRLRALHGAPPAFAEASWREPVIQPGPRTGFGRVTEGRPLAEQLLISFRNLASFCAGYNLGLIPPALQLFCPIKDLNRSLASG
jgi:hypothetical protein